MSNIKLPKAPLFRDPIYGGAADPTIIWNREEKSWWIIYTNRRASVNCAGVEWVFGTDLGVASSTDAGATWIYRGTLPNLEFEHGRNTFWAPEIIWNDGLYHMYVSYVNGIHSEWSTGDRRIIHYTSKNLWDWKYESILSLSSNRVIDACIFKLPDGIWRMWYKDESNNSFTYAADSEDLYTWKVVGPIITDCAHEGPNVFYWENKYWMITDPWNGLGVYSSHNCIDWTRQKNILDTPGSRKDDATIAHHGDVLVQGENAYIFYFTHPNLTKEVELKITADWAYEHKQTSLQVARLEFNDNGIACNRDKPFDFQLSEKFY